MAAACRLAALCLCLCMSTLACGAGSGVRPKVAYTAVEGVTHTPAPRPPGEIELLILGAPARAHVVVGRLTVRHADGDRPDRATQMQALRARAARLGCDAVLIEPPYDERVRVRFRFEHLTMTRPVLHGACIVYE
jgi:hypothetical protein